MNWLLRWLERRIGQQANGSIEMRTADAPMPDHDGDAPIRAHERRNLELQQAMVRDALRDAPVKTPEMDQWSHDLVEAWREHRQRRRR